MITYAAPYLGHDLARSPSRANALCRTSVDWSAQAFSSSVGKLLPATSGSMLARNPSARPAAQHNTCQQLTCTLEHYWLISGVSGVFRAKDLQLVTVTVPVMVTVINDARCRCSTGSCMHVFGAKLSHKGGTQKVGHVFVGCGIPQEHDPHSARLRYKTAWP